jgi:amidase
VGTVATFIERWEPGGPGLRVAVKDLIDVADTPTTAGCRAVARSALPAVRDAACLAGVREAEAAGRAALVGKTNLHELGFGVTGINPWYGTPTNPLDPGRPPGGSSSGSAVAVAAGEADVALGTDTGGSVRIPAACCGVVGLKTTWGRVPLDGVLPLAPSMDTVGPLARDVAGVIAGMALLCPGFAPGEPATAVGRIRVAGTDPAIDAACDLALARAELGVSEVGLHGWEDATAATRVVMNAEAWANDGALLRSAADGVGADVVARLERASAVGADEVTRARAVARAFGAEVAEAYRGVQVLALPVLTEAPPLMADAERLLSIRTTLPWNLAGLPALALPVPVDGGHLPASLQLVGPAGSEEVLVSTARSIERACAQG